MGMALGINPHLKTEIFAVQGQGFAYSIEVQYPGFCAEAAPLQNQSRLTICGINLVCSTGQSLYRLKDDYRYAVLAACDGLSSGVAATAKLFLKYSGIGLASCVFCFTRHAACTR
jgi:DNA-binding IclR family transcriptional regulator